MRLTTHLSIVAVMLTAMFSASAQPGNPRRNNDPDVPISGIEILIATGGLIGLRKLRKKKNIL